MGAQCTGPLAIKHYDLKDIILALHIDEVNYGNFMHGLMKENIQLNRKVLSELSMHEPHSFKALVDVSRKAFPGNKVPKKEGIAIVV
ncbi:hypothetical protein ACLOJK_027613 [Asimina triloba]